MILTLQLKSNFKLSTRTMRIARVSTVPFFVLTQLGAQINTLKKSGAIVTVITSPDVLSKNLSELDGVEFIPVNISREINPIRDFLSLVSLVKIFHSKNFDIVHSTTPKAGLLCAIAGRIAGVKIRLHTFTGQPWATMHGFKKSLLKFCDSVIGILNTHCYADSDSQKKFLIEHRVIRRSNISVLGAGSIAGVDLERFNSLRYSKEDIKRIKDGICIPQNSAVILFVGRITPEKGISELIQSFSKVLDNNIDVYLVLVGPYEEDGQLIVDSISDTKVSERVRSVGFSSQPENYMAVADILCLPSYREGFGTVVIEAAAMGVPTIGTNIYGLTDAIVHGETGLLVPVGDEVALALAIKSLLANRSYLEKMSIAARIRAVEFFGSEGYSEMLIKEYEAFFKK